MVPRGTGHPSASDTPGRTAQRTFRFSRETLQRLDERARELSESGNALAQRLLDEALRLERHPLVHFRAGAAGLRRPALAGTRLYIWQVLDVVRAGAGVDDAAEYLGLSDGQVRAAVAYYADNTDEVDHHAQEERDFARREQDRWERAQRVLG